MRLIKLSRFIDSVVTLPSTVAARIAGGVLLLLALLTAANVILRYIFAKPIQGAFEISEYMVAVICSLALAYTATAKLNVAIDLVVSKLSRSVRVVLDMAINLLNFILIFLITWQGFVYMLLVLEGGDFSGALHIPKYPFVLLFAVCALFLTLVLLRDFLASLAEGFEVTQGYRKIWLLVGTIISLLVVSAPIWGEKMFPDILPITVGFLGLGALIVLLFSRMPIGFVMAMVGFLGFSYIRGIDAGLSQLARIPYNSIANYNLSVIPLFILMGSFCFNSGLTKDLYYTAYRWLGHLPGGIAMATVGACGAFAAVSGSSLATAATMGTVALPEMKRYKYDTALATGSIAAGGTVGILIPPSVILIIYGIITEQSIGKLFLAGFIPGILEVIFYIVTIYLLCKRNPFLGPRGESTTFGEKIGALKDTWGVLILFFLVIGGIYAGVFTPTEAGGMGVFGALLFALGKRKLTLENLVKSLQETAGTTAMLFVIFIGAMILSFFLAASRLPFELAGFIAGLPVNRYFILAGILLLYICLGCFMDSLAMILLTIPIIFPLVVALGFDPIWFGIIIVRVVEMGLITPPVGTNVYIIKGVAPDVPMSTIFGVYSPFCWPTSVTSLYWWPSPN